MKKIYLVALAVILGATLIFGGCPKPATAPTTPPTVYEWKIQSGFPHGDASMEGLYQFAEKAEELSNGQLKIEVFAAPDIVTDVQVLEATKTGTLEMFQSCGTYWGGIVPVGEVEMGLPMLYKVPEAKDLVEANAMVTEFFNESGFIDLLREEYGKQGLYYLDIHTYSGTTINTTKPVKTLDDFKGMIIRSQGAFGEWIQGLGGSYYAGGGEEAYMNLKLGVIDGLHWDISAITGMRTNEVAPYLMMGPNNSILTEDVLVGHIMVNMDAWNSLPPELQKALFDAAEYYRVLTGQIYKGEWDKAYALVDKGELVLVPVDDAFVAKALEVAEGIWDEFAQRDEACARAIDMVKEWRGLE